MTKSVRCLRAAFVVLLPFWIFSGQAVGVDAQDRAGAPAAEQGSSDADTKAQRKRIFDEMRRRAEGTQIVRIHGGKKIPLKMVAEPVQRFNDHTRRIFDGTLWVFGTRRHPETVLKICCYHGRPGFRRYEYCLASLCDGLIEVRWPGELGWSSTKPGIDLHEISGGPKPASTEAGRLLQIKEAFRRFSALVTDYADVREEVRRLPRPLHRYRDPESGVQDGAVFAFGSNGTNPDLLLLIELRGPDPTRASWHFMPARLTTSQLDVRLDGKRAWSVPEQWHHGRMAYDTWIVFFPTQDNPDNMLDPANR